MAVTFARLKLRVLGNGLRGQTWRIVLFVVGLVIGLWFAGIGFLLFTLSGVRSQPELAVLVPAFGGGMIVLGWLLVPLVWSGVDETLDPARFALLPLSRPTVLVGLFTAALVGVPAVTTLVATAGLVVGAGRHGGLPAAATEAVAIVLGLLLCVAASRAMTSAFSSLLRARRTRDTAAVALAMLAALLGPLQIAVFAAAQRAGLDRLVRAAELLGWTPFGAPYLIGFDVAAGRYAAALGRLAITAGTIAVLLWWWARTLESAMLGVAAAGAAPERRRTTRFPVAQLLGRFPRTRSGALVAREVRYWWRDARRRASLITVGVLSVVIPFSGNLGALLTPDEVRTPPPPFGLLMGAMMTVGSLAAVSLANQFGFDGTAYAAHLIAGVKGRTELAARAIAYSVYILPLLVVASIVAAVLAGGPEHLPAMLGGVLAVYGAGLAVNLAVSVVAAYALPETSNPFAVNTGAGLAKSLLAMGALLGALAAAAPIVVLALVLDGVWSALLLPVGVVYGGGAVWLGITVVGELLDRRAPEVLAAVTPRR